MSKKSVVIQVSPSGVEVGVLAQGLCVAHAERAVISPDGPASVCVESLRQPVADCVADLGARGLSGVIISSLPGACVAVVDVAASAGARAGTSAAKLALFEVSHYSLDEHPFSCAVLCVDPAGATPRNRHMLASCDQDSNVQSLLELAAHAGVRIKGVIPADALEISAGIATPVDTNAGVSTSLWIGRRSSVLTCRINGGVKFVRSLSIGIDQIALALCRSLRVTSDPGDQREIKLTEREARELLLTIGIPAPDALFCTRRGIEGGCVLPALQPVMQRLAIEIKQSLRFGLSEEQRDGLMVRVDGPGADVPRLAELVARQAGVAASIVPASGTSVAMSPGLSMRTSWHRIDESSVGLMPWREVRRQDAARFGVAAWTGVAVAAAFVAGAGLWTSADLTQARSSLEKLNSPADATHVQNKHVAERVERINGLIRSIESRVERAMGPRADHGAVLRAVSQSTPPGFALSRIELASGEKGGTLSLAGQALRLDENAFGGALRTYCAKLGEWPVVRQVSIGNTGRLNPSTAEAASGHRFELKASVVMLPRSIGEGAVLRPPTASVQTREGQP